MRKIDQIDWVGSGTNAFFLSFSGPLRHKMSDYDPFEDAGVDPECQNPMQPNVKRHRVDVDSNTSIPKNIVHQGTMATAVPVNALTPEGSMIFVWDLDETLILFNSVLNGAFQSNLNEDVPSGQVCTQFA